MASRGGQLTERERERILALSDDGLSVTEIAQYVSRCPSTVRRAIRARIIEHGRASAEKSQDPHRPVLRFIL